MTRRHDYLTVGLRPTPFDLYVMVGQKQLRRFCKECEIPTTDIYDGNPNCLGRTRQFEAGNLVVWLSDDAVTDSLGPLVQTCAHEALHVVNFLTEHIGETKKTHEIECYWVGFVAEHIFDQALKRREQLGVPL